MLKPYEERATRPLNNAPTPFVDLVPLWTRRFVAAFGPCFAVAGLSWLAQARCAVSGGCAGPHADSAVEAVRSDERAETECRSCKVRIESPRALPQREGNKAWPELIGVRTSPNQAFALDLFDWSFDGQRAQPIISGLSHRHLPGRLLPFSIKIIDLWQRSVN